MHWFYAALLVHSVASTVATSVYNATETPQLEDGATVAADFLVLPMPDWFQMTPPLLPISVASSDHILSPRCRNQSQLYLQELRNFTLWAVQMFDAAAKVPVGMLAGNQYQMGHYDECLEISVNVGEKSGGKLRGQYCLAEIRFESSYKPTVNPYTVYYDPGVSAWEKIKYKHDPSKVRRDIMHWALCMPSSCSSEELHEALNHELQKMGEVHGVRFSSWVTPDRCHTQQESQPLSLGDIVFLFILFSLITLVVTSTWYDFTYSDTAPEKAGEQSAKKPSKVTTLLMCFSARRNLKKLMIVSSTQPSIDASHGPRVIFMLLIIMGHRMTTFAGHPIFNAGAEERMFRKVPDIVLANGPLIVDGFFAMSGILLSYPLLVLLGKTGHMNLVVPIIVRFIRLTPSYMMLVFFHATLLPHMGSGPFWDSLVGLEQRRCADNWWLNLLYINNYVNVGDMCMFQSWYVAADFHLYIISLLVVYAVWRWPRLGYTVLGLLTTLSVIVPFALIYQTKADPLLYPYPDNVADVRASWFFQSIYVATHNRAAPYFIGVSVGILLYKLRNNTYRLARFPSNIAFILTVWVFGLVVMVSAYVFFIPDRPYNALEVALYGSLHRVGFGLAVSFFFIIITFGQIDGYQRFFSSKTFVVLSRLTYGAYLAHTMGQLYDQGSLRMPRYLSPYTALWMTIADATFAFGMALILLLLIECPFRSIQKIIFGTT